MQKTAILLGITGLTGGILAKKILINNQYSQVISFTRKPSGIKNPKLTEHVIDLFKLEDYAEEFIGDVVFCCIGTTQAKTPDKEVYHKVDYGIPLSAARLCKLNGINTMITISAMGADAKSRVFYNRTKGEMERDILNLDIKNSYFMQPALIAGDRKEKRLLENLGKQVMKIINPLLIGSLKKYQSIHPDQIAEAMMNVAENGHNKKRIPSDEIKKIANGIN
ncbi:MAG: nucleoside-diphosphate sugar epimerase [Leeuwenhoekiella sp.]